jgi:hypothetical protein
MYNSAPKTIPKDAKAGHGYQFHERIYPGTQTPVAMGSPYESKSGSRVAKESSTFSKGKPMYESSKDPAQVRTTGMESSGR